LMVEAFMAPSIAYFIKQQPSDSCEQEIAN
jgi:hypothetical protein